MKQLEVLQDEQYEWSRRNFGPQDAVLPLLGVAEEVGELCHAVLKQRQGIRVNEDHLAMEKDAIGDIVIYLMDYCNRRGYNLLELVNAAWDIVSARDWTTSTQRADGTWVLVNPTEKGGADGRVGCASGQCQCDCDVEGTSRGFASRVLSPEIAGV